MPSCLNRRAMMSMFAVALWPILVMAQWQPTTGSGSIYYNGGNVGIGTTVPAYRFHVAGGRSVFEAAGEVYALGLRYSGANGNSQFWLGASNSAAPDLILSNMNGSEIARFQSGGNVGIGTPAPAYNFHVVRGRS